ncbi:hypothetical protein GEMRC1_003460 [Eukaryota sp. GEM-RC1]
MLIDKHDLYNISAPAGVSIKVRSEMTASGPFIAMEFSNSSLFSNVQAESQPSFNGPLMTRFRNEMEFNFKLITHMCRDMDYNDPGTVLNHNDQVSWKFSPRGSAASCQLTYTTSSHDFGFSPVITFEGTVPVVYVIAWDKTALSIARGMDKEIVVAIRK